MLHLRPASSLRKLDNNKKYGVKNVRKVTEKEEKWRKRELDSQFLWRPLKSTEMRPNAVNPWCQTTQIAFITVPVISEEIVGQSVL